MYKIETMATAINTHKKEIKALLLLFSYLIFLFSLGMSMTFTLISLMDFSFMSIEEKLLYASMAAYTSWMAILIYCYLKYK